MMMRLLNVFAYVFILYGAYVVLDSWEATLRALCVVLAGYVFQRAIREILEGREY